MNTEQKTTNPSMAGKPKKQAINYGKLWEDIKKHKRHYYIVLPVSFLLAAIYLLSLPNYYACSVALAPEISGLTGNRSSSLSSLASSFGINLGNVSKSNSDAIRPDLYPELMNSVAFRASLFNIKVQRLKEDTLMTYYDYLLYGQNIPWWSEAKKSFFSIFSKKKEPESKEVNTFKLTKEQSIVDKMIKNRVICNVDKKTFVITIKVTDQDPLIAATMADSVQQRLQKFITNYRTRKARIDVEHYRTIEAQSKKQYEDALAKYSWFSDHNQKIFLERVRGEKTKLENEMQLQQRAYLQIAAQLQVAEAKLQEDTPAFTTLQPATVPIKKAGPARSKNCLVFLFLAFICTTIYVFNKEGDLKPLLGL